VTDYSINFFENQKGSQVKLSILVVTPSIELGEIICESLKEAATIKHLTSAAKAISFLRENQTFKQVLLDMELGEFSLLNLGRSLRLIDPSIGILIISREEPPTDLDEIQPWSFLRKPLLLRDLQAALGIENDREDKYIEIESLVYDNKAALNWSNNASLATRYLMRLLEKSYAQEVLLIQNQSLWSYAGQLPEDSVHELERKVTKSYIHGNSADFIRYIKLDTTQTEHSLYVILIAIGVILALVFEPDVPLTIVRRQTHKFADTLFLLDGEDVQVKAISTRDGENNLNDRKKTNSLKKNNNFFPKMENDDQEIGSKSHSENKSLNPSVTWQRTHEMMDQTANLEALDDMKLPKPSGEPTHLTHTTRETEDGATGHFTISTNCQTSTLPETMSDSQYNLSYSYMLIPRFPYHRLTREKVDLISECIKKINISYGWRLESVEFQPEYLRWTTSLPPSIAPTDYLETIRQETSKRIFDDFPIYREENPSGDYWAPGFLIIGGKNAISDQLALAYTKQNRQKHGISVY